VGTSAKMLSIVSSYERRWTFLKAGAVSAAKHVQQFFYPKDILRWELFRRFLALGVLWSFLVKKTTIHQGIGPCDALDKATEQFGNDKIPIKKSWRNGTIGEVIFIGNYIGECFGPANKGQEIKTFLTPIAVKAFPRGRMKFLNELVMPQGSKSYWELLFTGRRLHK